MPTIRAVLLDADGVVQLPGSTWSASLGVLCGDPSRADEFRTDVFAAEKPGLTGAADFESALGQVLRKWQSTVSVEVALRAWTDIEPATDILDLVHSLRLSGIRSRVSSTSHLLWRRSRKSHRKCFSLMIMRPTSRLPEVAVYTERCFICLKAWGECMRFSNGMALMFPNKAPP
jgi:hypothetical protein